MDDRIPAGLPVITMLLSQAGAWAWLSLAILEVHIIVYTCVTPRRNCPIKSRSGVLATRRMYFS